MKKVVLFSLAFACLLISKPILAQQQLTDEAQRHFNRGLAATEGAKSIDDYKEAINEFEKAKKFAPNWPDVYYNLGLLYEKIEDYPSALFNLAFYRGLVREASDRDKAQQLIDKIEFKQEKLLKLQSLIRILCDPNTEWIADQYGQCGLGHNTLRFRQFGSVAKVEVEEYTYLNDWAKKAIPPPLPDTWVTVRFEGNRLYYDYIYHCREFAGTPYYRPIPVHKTAAGELQLDDFPNRLKIKWTKTEPAAHCDDTPSCELIYEKRGR